jgi:two-component system chemotaxis sensor kinase CheA
MVERIEKIKATDIETVGGKRVIRYRGGSLPLFSVDEVAMVQPLADVEDLLVIVFILSGKEIGLLAIGPVDAIEISWMSTAGPSNRPASWDRLSSTTTPP